MNIHLIPEVYWNCNTHFQLTFYSLMLDHIHTHTTYIHTYIHTHIHTFIHKYIHTLHTYIHKYIHTHMHTYIYTYINTYINIHTYINTYIHLYIHKYTYIHNNRRTKGGTDGWKSSSHKGVLLYSLKNASSWLTFSMHSPKFQHR